MKYLVLFMITLIPIEMRGSDRIWNNQGPDNGTVHSLGNGKMLVYETGPNITTLFPGPYTTPSLCKFMVDRDRPLAVESVRKEGTALWTHSLFTGEEEIGKMTDFVDAELPCMIRRLELKAPLRFRLELLPGLMTDLQQASGNGRMLIRMDPGERIYQYYVYPKPLYHCITWQGNASVVKSAVQEHVYYLELAEGISEIWFTGGPELDDVINHTDQIKSLGYDLLLKRTEDWWHDFTARRTDFSRVLPGELPHRNKLLKTIDEVSVMIRTQQAEEGAVMAGYPYPLGYVRDQYGVSRGYLALGYVDEARHILEFYNDIWKKTGELHCAQGIGVDGIFHIHENDEVESPGYLIMQAFDLYKKSGDIAFLRSIFPMLEWCWEVQKKHLAGNMLPFNGDETYVAGGILPRSALNDGSSEATLLFIDGGELLLNWIEEQGMWETRRIKADLKLLEEVKNDFRNNFWREGHLITNNPQRTDELELPLFRHGVCERGGEHCLVYRSYGFGGIDWTRKDTHDRYQCMNCFQEGSLPSAEKQVYKLLTVSLTPLYFHSDMIEPEELKGVIDVIYQSFRQSGVLTSRTDVRPEDENARSVGYDYGLVLYGMLKTGNAGAGEVYSKTLEIVDETGAWSEYYLGEVPSGTRCRPWESAINLEALLEYAINYRP